MSRRFGTAAPLVLLIAAAALFVLLGKAEGTTPASDSASAGRRLAEAWCKTCHAIESSTAGTLNPAPDFMTIASQPSTTELSLKVFLRSSHRNMPNLVLTPDQADDLASYIVGLRRQ